MRRASATAVALAALAQLPAAASSAAAERLRFAIDVPRPGLVTVELDAAALARLGDAGGVEVLDPDGARVDAERLLAREDTPCRAVTVGEVRRDTDAWTLGVDLEDDPEPHAALVFELEAAVLASGCALEGSADGRSWQALAQGDLFRLGERRGLARTRLQYPASRYPKLRLRWPAAAGYPRVRSVEVCAPEEPAPAPVVEIAAGPAAPGGAGARWRLPLPSRAARVRALRLARDASPGGALQRLAWRLELAQEGAWHELSQGVWPAGEERLRVALGDVAFVGRALRLELWGAAELHPRLSWELAPQRVRFVSTRAGRFALLLPAPARPVRLSMPPGSEPVRAALGPPAAQGAAPEPEGGLGAAAPERRFAARWRVEAPPGLAVGTPVALELPPLDGVAAADRADVRLVAAGRLVPARIGSVAEPVSSVLARSALPQPRGAGRSRVRLDLGGVSGRPTTLRLRVGPEAGSFRRGVALLGRVDPAPGSAAVTVSRGLWECAPDPPRPCEVTLRLGGAVSRDLEVVIEDGDAAPLGALDAELESAHEEALFLWPGTTVELVAGARGLEAPRFDLARLDAALALRPPLAVRARPAHSGGAASERWSRPLLVLAVAAVAVALLALLRRLLPGPGAPG